MTCESCKRLRDGLEVIAALSADTSRDSCERKQLLDQIYEQVDWLLYPPKEPKGG